MRRRLFLAAAALLFLAFAAYGSFVPFNFHRVPIAEAVSRFRAEPLPNFPSASNSDFVANVLLFVPIGFTVTGLIADRSRWLAWLALPLVTAFALAVSVGVEFGQIFMQGRTPSWNDVLGETLGAVVGGIGWAITGVHALEWMRPLINPSTPIERAQRLLGIYALVWLVLQVLPLDFTLRPAELAEKYRAGRIVVRPFAESPAFGDRVVKFASTAIPALPIGALAALSVTRRSRLAWGAALGVGAVTLLEAVQLLIMSRWSNVTDVICGGAGAILGAWLSARWAGTLDRTTSGAADDDSALRPWALILLLGWLVVLVYRHWTPFDFAVTRGMFDARFHRLYSLPFRSYFWSNYLLALSEAFTKILLGVPVGALLQIFWRPPKTRSVDAVQIALFLGVGLVVFTALEIGQVFLPSRVPDGTDVVLAVFGVGAGIAAVRLVSSTVHRH